MTKFIKKVQQYISLKVYFRNGHGYFCNRPDGEVVLLGRNKCDVLRSLEFMRDTAKVRRGKK